MWFVAIRSFLVIDYKVEDGTIKTSYSTYYCSQFTLLRWLVTVWPRYHWWCIYVYMYVRIFMYVWSSHIARVWINRVRLPISLVVGWTGKINISPVPVCAWEFVRTRRARQSRPASACSSPYPGWIWCLLTGFLPISAAASIYWFKPACVIGSVPSWSRHAIAYRGRSLPRVCRHTASKPQGSSKRVLPWQVTMDQLICASLSHTHYWYEVGMLKVPANWYNILST